MYLTTTECAKLTGIRSKIIADWARKGLIKSNKAPTHKPHHYITQEELLAFAKRMKMPKKIIDRIASVREAD